MQCNRTSSSIWGETMWCLHILYTFHINTTLTRCMKYNCSFGHNWVASLSVCHEGVFGHIWRNCSFWLCISIENRFRDAVLTHVLFKWSQSINLIGPSKVERVLGIFWAWHRDSDSHYQALWRIRMPTKEKLLFLSILNDFPKLSNICDFLHYSSSSIFRDSSKAQCWCHRSAARDIYEVEEPRCPEVSALRSFLCLISCFRFLNLSILSWETK